MLFLRVGNMKNFKGLREVIESILGEGVKEGFQSLMVINTYLHPLPPLLMESRCFSKISGFVYFFALQVLCKNHLF